MSLDSSNVQPDTINSLLLVDDSQDSSFVPPSSSSGSESSDEEFVQPAQSVSATPVVEEPAGEECEHELVERFYRYLARRYSKATSEKYTACLKAVLDPDYDESSE